jgi:hypothetical protein
MEIIVREVGNKLLRFPFLPNAQRWLKQNPPAEFCITDLGRVTCFVKRQNKQFSGWRLLVKAISEEQIKNAPRVISLAQDQSFYYYFTEKLEGVTLDEFLKKNPVSKLDLTKLVNDVFIALCNINQHGFWYSDLCKKNVFVLKSGNFSLIDLDSCLPNTELFDYHGKTACEYPPLLTEFARNAARKNYFKIKGMSGECVNQAEIIAMAVDSKKLFQIPMDKKIAVLHRCLMREAEQEYKDLFIDLIDGKPSWVKTRKVINKLLS